MRGIFSRLHSPALQQILHPDYFLNITASNQRTFQLNSTLRMSRALPQATQGGIGSQKNRDCV